MDSNSSFPVSSKGAPAEYVTAMAEIELRAGRGELSVRQVRLEILALRERLGIDAALVMQWTTSGQ